jgi:hypothetical protein
MKEFIKKNLALISAFLLPIILIVVVAVVSYLPSLFISTNYDFIYATCTKGTDYYPYDCNKYLNEKYSIRDNKLILTQTSITTTTTTIATTIHYEKNSVPPRTVSGAEQYNDRIFLHNTKNNESREITLEEAKGLTLNSLLTSPDGITISSNYGYRGGDFIIFSGGRTTYSYYLSKGKGKSKLNLINNNDQNYYQNNFKFLGWVLPGKN